MTSEPDRKHVGHGVTVARINMWECWCEARWLADPQDPYIRNKCPNRPKRKKAK